jgi:hypothetical protein
MVAAEETAVAEGTAAEDGDGAIRSYPDGHLFWVAFPISAPFVLCLLRFRVSRRLYSPYVLERPSEKGYEQRSDSRVDRFREAKIGQKYRFGGL